MSNTPSDWKSSMGIAKAILHDRLIRRQWMARWLMVTICWMVMGLWVIDGWLAENILRFSGWWLFCGFLAITLTIFALYDMLATIGEERKNR